MIGNSSIIKKNLDFKSKTSVEQDIEILINQK